MPPPLFPTLKPKLIDATWFNVDQPWDEESEVDRLEREHHNWLNSISQRNSDLTPIGKSSNEPLEEDEDDDDEDDNDDDDESDTHDEEDEDEIDMNVPFDANSAAGALRGSQGQSA